MGRKKGLTIGKVRSSMYKSAKILGDINAVARGTVPQRLVRRATGSIASQILSAIVNAIFGGRR